MTVVQVLLILSFVGGFNYLKGLDSIRFFHMLFTSKMFPRFINKFFSNVGWTVPSLIWFGPSLDWFGLVWFTPRRLCPAYPRRTGTSGSTIWKHTEV